MNTKRHNSFVDFEVVKCCLGICLSMSTKYIHVLDAKFTMYSTNTPELITVQSHISSPLN